MAQGGASNVAENINTDLATQPQVILAQPTVNVAMTAVASALLASDPARIKMVGNINCWRMRMLKAMLNQNEEPEKVKAEEAAGPDANVEEALTPIKAGDQTVINEFNFEGLFEAGR